MPSAERPPKNPKFVAASAPSGDDYLRTLRAVGLAAGLHDLGVAPARPLERARRQIEDRIDKGLVNGMKFTFHRPERSTHPEALVEGARTIVVGVASYDVAGSVARTTGRARVARYAWADHYAQLKASLTSVAARLRTDGHRAVVFADDNSVVDREVAWLAGLGWYGKNANILVPGAGSWFVIGCIVTTADLPTASIVDDGCGPCTRCIPACPTGAIVAPGVIDANRCLSWLLQKPGIFDRRFREALGDRIYGCDECQSACPVNKRGSIPVREVGVEVRSHVDVLAWLQLDDAQLDDECERWWVHEREMTWVRRNLLVTLGNVGDPGDAVTSRVLVHYLRGDNPVLAAHAVWAAARMGLHDLLGPDVLGNIAELHPMVRDELDHLPTLREDV